MTICIQKNIKQVKRIEYLKEYKMEHNQLLISFLFICLIDSLLQSDTSDIPQS